MIETVTLAPDADPARIEWTRDADSSLVENATLGYKEGMKTETRPAPQWRIPIRDYATHLAAKRRSRGTIYLRTYHVRVLSNAFRFRSPFEITTGEIEAFLASLGRGHSKNTARSYLTSIRDFYRWADRSERIDRDPCRYIESISPVVGTPRPADWDDINDAIERAEPRVRLMIQIAATAGLRAFEIAAINRADLYYDRRNGWALSVPRGKGEKPRTVPLLPIVAGRMQEAFDASPEEWLFPSNKRGSFGRHIEGKRVTELVSEVLPAGVTCHTLRHTFATTHYRAEHDLLKLRALLGHESVRTTEVYTKVPDDMRAGIDAIGSNLR